MIFLKTERLILRNVTPDDAPIMYDYRNNELCARYQRGQTRDLNGIQELASRRQNDILGVDANCMVAVALKETNEMIGEIVVMPNDGCISLGYTFSYKYHRMGYAFEALSMLSETLHARYPQWEFISFVEPENVASRGLLHKLGYTDYGYVEKISPPMYMENGSLETR